MIGESLYNRRLNDGGRVWEGELVSGAGSVFRGARIFFDMLLLRIFAFA